MYNYKGIDKSFCKEIKSAIAFLGSSLEIGRRIL